MRNGLLTKYARGIGYNICEKGDAMSYEIYVDKLFVINFCMNLYILFLINGATLRTATRGRLSMGAFVGALCYMMPFFMTGAVFFKLLLGYGVGTVIMLRIAFSFTNWSTLVQLFQKMLLYSFLLGGMMLCVLKLPFARALGLATTWGFVGMGAAMTLLLSIVWNRQRRGELCRVILVNKNDKITISALIDSGNSLVEPISGMPVSVIDKDIFEHFYQKQNLKFRVIPYTSVGKKRGILHGYLIPELQIEVNGMLKKCTNVYVALRDQENEENNEMCEKQHCEEKRVKIILHPQLLESYGTVRKKGRKRGWNHDIKGCNAGENAY